MEMDEEERIAAHRQAVNYTCSVRREIRHMIDPFAVPENQFRNNFRLPKMLARLLIRQLAQVMDDTDNVLAIPLSVKVLTALAFYSNGGYQGCVGANWLLCLGRSTTGHFIEEVTEGLNHPRLQTAWIRFPRTRAERERLILKHEVEFSIPGIIGFIDGTEVSIVTPHSPLNAQAFWTRKHQYAINCQIICDSNLRILNVVANHPGCCNDAFIYRGCAARTRMMEAFRQEGCWLLGDGGYPLEPWLMVPIENAEEGSVEELFTNRHCKARCSVERCIGVLKGRFRCLLRARVLHYSPLKSCRIIKACCVLHNMAQWGRLEYDQAELENLAGEEQPRPWVPNEHEAEHEELEDAEVEFEEFRVPDNARELQGFAQRIRLEIAQHLARHVRNGN